MNSRVRTRPIEMSDLDNMMDWVNDTDVIGNFANFNAPISREEEAKFLEKIISSETDKLFAVENQQGDYLGNIGIHQIHWPTRSGRLAVIMGNKDYWGKGYAQDSVQEVLRLAFEHYNLHKVWIVTFETNERMRHIMEKSGFQREGVLRDEYFHKGKYHNMIRMSILDREYFELNSDEGGIAA